jgi:hypothetical protein
MSTHPPPAEGGLPSDLVARVEAELASGEKVVWVGQPLITRYARMSIPMVITGIFFILFSLVWIAMTAGGYLFARAAAADMTGSGGFSFLFGCFPLCGFPIALIGLGLITAPFWMQRLARRTCYSLTDRRAIVFEPSFFGIQRVRSYTASGLGAMSRMERSDGTGDLIFEEHRGRGSDGDTQTTRRGFLAIAKVREVEDLIRKTLLGG